MAKTKAIDRIFVKRYWIGIKGTGDYDQLVEGRNVQEARLRYARRRNYKRTPSNIIHKRHRKYSKK
jgi:hypothetical protein